MSAGVAVCHAGEKPEVIVTVDYFDSVYFRTPQNLDCGPDYIRNLTADLAKHGATAIVVRLSAGGLFEYKSALSYPVQDFDVRHVDRMLKLFTKVDGLNDVEKFKKQRVEAHTRFGELLDEFDPRREFVKSGHAAGLKVILWMDIFDDGYPGYRSKFIEQNPECVWTSRSGFRHPAVISYAFEKSRQFRVDHARELLDAGADGVYLSMSAHSRHFYLKDDPGEFGYEAPVAEIYRRYTGRDLLHDKQLDRRLWHHIKGEFMTRFYERIADECHRRAQPRECWVGMQLGTHTNLTTDGNYTGPPRITYENQWEYLTDHGIADALILADYEHVDLFAHPRATRYWQNKNIPAKTESEVYAWAGRNYRRRTGKTPLYVWGNVTSSKLADQTGNYARMIRSSGFDGMMMHEARDFEVGGMRWLQKFSQLVAPSRSTGPRSANSP